MQINYEVNLDMVFGLLCDKGERREEWKRRDEDEEKRRDEMKSSTSMVCSSLSLVLVSSINARFFPLDERRHGGGAGSARHGRPRTPPPLV